MIVIITIMTSTSYKNYILSHNNNDYYYKYHFYCYYYVLYNINIVECILILTLISRKFAIRGFLKHSEGGASVKGPGFPGEEL